MSLTEKTKGEKRESGDGQESKSESQDMETESTEGENYENWTMEEKDKLLQFVTKVFLMNFPSYIAYKHVVHSSLEVSSCLI